MMIVAKRAGQGVYIVGESPDKIDAQGCIVDLDRGKKYPTMAVHSLLARGYWEEFKGSKRQETRVLNLVSELPVPGTREGR